MKRKYIKTIVIALVVLSFLWILIFNLKPDDKSKNVNTDKINEVLPTDKSDFNLDSNEFELVDESKNLQLFVKPSTAEIAIKDKRGNYTWYSNPQDRDKDTQASGYVKGKLASQISVNYLTKGGQVKEYDSFNDSIKHKQYLIKKSEKGIKVIYTLGNIERGIESIPKKISAKRFSELILSKVDEKDKEELDKRFRFIKEKDVYERRDMPKFIVPNIIEILDKVGYTEEDLEFDNEENGIRDDPDAQIEPQFTVPVDYYLENDNLMVNINSQDISTSKNAKLHTIQLMEYFGAAGKSDEGYMLVPDGSGALIYLNNNKKTVSSYIGNIYGDDKAIINKEKVAVTETARVPVYGLKNGDHAFFAIIEDGDGIGSIISNVSGKISSYNNIYSRYTLLSKDTLTISSLDKETSAPVFQKESYKGDIKVRFEFLSGEESNYVGMAHTYQDYLIDKFSLTKLDKDNNLPFYVELIGDIPIRKSFLGVPYDSMETLTSYKDAETILNQLKDEDVKDIRLIYKGWFNGGVNHDFPTKIELDEGVGNKKQLSNLIEYLNRNNISLYPDVAFGTVYRQGNGFKASKDAALYMTQKTAKIYNYNLATYMQETDEIKGYVLSPLRLPNLVNKFMPKFKEYGFENIAIRDLGNELNSDFNENRVVNREQNKEIIQEQLEAMKKGCKDILVNGGNAYTLPYTKNIVNLPTEYSNFNILDESIPFYQIVLHGYIDYAGKPLNYDIDAGYKKKLLKILETGSGVSYQWIYQDPSLFKETEFDYMYSAYYKDWIEEGIDIYKEANKVLGDLEGQRIESHKKLENNVYETIYENGTKIIVNYNNHGIKVENHFIEAEDYWVGGE